MSARFVYRPDGPFGPDVIDRKTGRFMLLDLAREYAAVVNSACRPREGKVTTQRRDAARYAYLRSRPLDAIQKGGVFAGLVPDNVVLNGDDLDAAVDAALQAQSKEGGAAC